MIIMICSAFIKGLSVGELETELFAYSNLCLRYAWGICIHPECCYNHASELENILYKYYQERNKLKINKAEIRDALTNVGFSTRA